MSRTLASAVLTALKSTAIVVTSLTERDAKVYVAKASTTEVLAIVFHHDADEFSGELFEVIEQRNGIHYFASNESELKAAMERVPGYPTEADMRRNWSKPVYTVTDY